MPYSSRSREHGSAARPAQAALRVGRQAFGLGESWTKSAGPGRCADRPLLGARQALYRQVAGRLGYFFLFHKHYCGDPERPGQHRRHTSRMARRNGRMFAASEPDGTTSAQTSGRDPVARLRL